MSKEDPFSRLTTSTYIQQFTYITYVHVYPTIYLHLLTYIGLSPTFHRYLINGLKGWYFRNVKYFDPDVISEVLRAVNSPIPSFGKMFGTLGERWGLRLGLERNVIFSMKL